MDPLTTTEKSAAQADLDAACDQIKGKADQVQFDLENYQQALDEVSRERGVRERCYPRWIQEGRVSKSDAKDRLDRIIKAEQILQKVLDKLASGTVPF